MNEEIWKSYKTRKSNFEISNFGNVRGAEVTIVNGRRYVGTLQVFKLVWKLFVGQVPKGYVVHHIDHNKLNDRLNNLTLMTIAEHSSHHNKGQHQSKTCSNETRKKISKSMKGNQNAKDYHHSEEAKRKIGETMKDRKWFNNGIINCFTFECPEGFVPGILKKENNENL